MSSPVTIALLWHQMNSDNLGVGALSISNIDILRSAAKDAGKDVRFLAIGWRDSRPWYQTMDDVENVAIRTRHLFLPGGPFSEAISRSDIVFDIGAGDSFTDIYGFKRFLVVWLAKARTIMKGRKLILSPQTIGPFRKWWSKSLALWTLNRSEVVTRDSLSSAFAREIGFKGYILESTDVAMRLPYQRSNVASGDRIRVGINVSGLLMSGGYSQSNQFGLTVDYPKLMRSIVNWFHNNPKVELHLVGHVQSDTFELEDDQRASVILSSEFPGVVVAPVFKSPVDAKGYISTLDFFVGSRMHATIAAFSTGVPVLPLAYSRKFYGVFGDLGYKHVIDLKTSSNSEVMEKIEQSFLHRDLLAQSVSEANKRADEFLEEYKYFARKIILES